MNVPEWVRRHGAALMESTDGRTWFLLIGDQPMYKLRPTPVKGRHGCAITQSNNSKRIPSDSLADSPDGALQAGLEDLGKYLGWTG
jgi:hypothetical protein